MKPNDSELKRQHQIYPLNFETLNHLKYTKQNNLRKAFTIFKVI